MQTIISGGGDQEVEVYAQDSAGRLAVPASATAQIVDLTLAEGADARIIVATTAADIDAVDTTTTSDAGFREPDPRLLEVADATGIVVGRQYQVASSGRIEAGVVDRVSGFSVYLRDPLRYAHATGATVKGLRVSFTFPANVSVDGVDRGSDVAAELESDVQFGVDWTFVGTGGPSPVRTLAKIQRRAKALRATVADMLRVDPQLSATTQSRSRLDSHLAQADIEITALLQHRNVDDANTVDGEAGKLAVTWRAVELAYRVLDSNASHADRADWAAGEARRWRKMLTDGHKSTDRAETSRETDRVRKVRRPTGIGVIRGEAT